MGIAYQADGSVICTGDANPARTATYAGPKNAAAQLSSIASFFGQEPVPASPVPGTIDWLMALTLASAAPPAVADTGAAGTAATVLARSDHTHASKVRKQRVTGVNTATYKWTYPTPFDAGVIPECQAIVEDPANSVSDSYNVEIIGIPNSTDCTFRIIRQSTGLLALLTGALSLNPTPGTINLHCQAAQP